MSFSIKLAIALTIIFNLGCSKATDTGPMGKDILARIYSNHKEVFVDLREQIVDELGKGRILEIGEKGIEVSGLDAARHQNYIEKLTKIEIERITAFRNEENSIEVEFLVARTGMAFSGCSSTISYLSEGQPFKPEWADPYVSIDFGEGWFGESKCN